MMLHKMAALAALMATSTAIPLEKDSLTRLDSIAGGGSTTAMSSALSSAMSTYIETSLNTILSGDACAAGATPFSVTSLTGVTSGIDQSTLDYYQLTAVTNRGSVSLRLDVETTTGTVKKAKDLSTFAIFPDCVAKKLAAAKKKIASSETPSSTEEASIASTALASDDGEAGHDDPLQLLQMNKINKAARLYANKTARLPTHTVDGVTYHLGDVHDPKETAKYHVTLTSTGASSLSDYSPFTGAAAACLSKFPARNQGQCGSCWSFASSSSFSLKYCLAVYAAGYSHSNTNIPVLTPQNMVTCPKDISGINGCNGGTGGGAFRYIKQYGISSVACLPYMSGSTSSNGGVVAPNGAGGTSSFDASDYDGKNGCYTQCISGYRALHPAKPMRFISGDTTTSPLSFTGEANIMEAIKLHGPLYIAFKTYTSFTSPSDWTEYIYREPAAGLGTDRGGHAVVVYGWGTSTNGVKYWKLINSWGAWGIPGTNGEFYFERGVDLCNIETLGAWTIALDTADVHLGPPSNTFSCSTDKAFTGSTHSTSTGVADLNACKSKCFDEPACEGLTFTPGPTPTPTMAPTFAPTSACTDSSTWSINGNNYHTCAWFASNDPGCTRYVDYGQKEDCKVTCNKCPTNAPTAAPTAPVAAPGTCVIKSSVGGETSSSGSTACTITRPSPPPLSPPPPSPSPPSPPKAPTSCTDATSTTFGLACSASAGYCSGHDFVRKQCPETCGGTACQEACADKTGGTCLTISGVRADCAAAAPYCSHYSCVKNDCPTTCGGNAVCTNPATKAEQERAAFMQLMLAPGVEPVVDIVPDVIPGVQPMLSRQA